MVDLGSIFDLGTLRPFESLHLIPSANAAGHDWLKNASIHSIAIQVPKTRLTKGGWKPTDSDRRPLRVGGVRPGQPAQGPRILERPEDVESGRGSRFPDSAIR